MFCPECGGEYRPGFTVCHDCNVALVERLPEELESAGEEAGDDPARSDLVLLGDVFDRYHAAALAERFELESIGYVLQYGSAMEQLEGRRLFGRRERAWRGLVWVTPKDLVAARTVAAEVIEQMRQETETD